MAEAHHIIGLLIMASGIIAALYSAIKVSRVYYMTTNARPIEATIHDTGITKTGSKFYPSIEFEYTFDGETYESRRIFPSGHKGKSDRSWAESILQDYEEGTTVPGLINPREPEKGFLRNESLFHSFVLFIGGILVGMLGATIFVGV